MTLTELYQSARTGGSDGEIARQLLDQTHWFTENSEFDPKTGDALPQELSAFLAKLSRENAGGRIQDRLYRIVEHARPAVERLLRALHESPRREHAIMPVRAVRELDAGCFIKLSMRPGRNIREKLAGKPFLQAIRRFQSVNLPENRLLKAYVSRLAELLELRQDCLGDPEDDLLIRIQSWLFSDTARSVGDWENLPPNNALLAHRDYRRVWDSWRRLQTLDDDIARDLSRLDIRRDTMRRWMDHGQMYRDGSHLFAEMPVLFDYEDFSILTWQRDPLIQRSKRRHPRSYGEKTVAEPACVDLTEMRPRYAVTPAHPEVLTEVYLWQQWRNAAETVDITLFNADAAYLHPDATTIACSDLFFIDEGTTVHCDRAARAFASRLRDTFRHDKIIWLVPDALNDFELEVVRRNLNAHFPGAEPIPRSVSAVFEQVDYTRITNDGFPVIVIDTTGGVTCLSKLIARFDADLKKRLPETNGYYWERCPPVVLSEQDVGEDRRYDMITVDSNGQWFDCALPERPEFIDPHRLKTDPRVGQFAFCINLSSSPVAGGIRLFALQARAGDIPLWRDQIPELSIKVMKDGRYQRFDIVSRGTTIKPIRGLSVQIPIVERFTLPAGLRFYQFPLYQGENAAELRFSARLDSPAFPLKANTECDLILTFQYGDDEPYTLVFAPLDKSFPPVRATWQRTVEEIVTDAPSPGYPEPLSWDDLRRMPKPDSDETSDLLEWVVSAIDRLDRDLFIRPRPRALGTLRSGWLIDRKGDHFAFAECTEATERVFIHERSFLTGVSFLSFQEGDELTFELQERGGRYSGWKVDAPDYVEQTRWRHHDDNGVDELIKNIRKRLYFPVIQVWRDGRSIRDRQCPKEFAGIAADRIAYLQHIATSEELPQAVRFELLFLLSCLHKDTLDDCVQWITTQAEGGTIRHHRAIGYALGDVSQNWQQYVYDRLASHPGNDTINVFAYAIWRERHFVERISLSELQALTNALSQRLANVHPVRSANGRRNGRFAIRNWARATAEPLELLLGLLRTRASDDPEIRMVLQPHQKMAKLFAEQIDRIEDILAETHVTLFSRVQINIQKPEGVRTPDLLYALRLYLTGDTGANAIHITGISDTDDD